MPKEQGDSEMMEERKELPPCIPYTVVSLLNIFRISMYNQYVL